MGCRALIPLLGGPIAWMRVKCASRECCGDDESFSTRGGEK
jgi:hypothetical protein